MNRSHVAGAFFGIVGVLSLQLAIDTYRSKRGPFDALVDHAPVCAAAKKDTGTRIVLEGVLRGPCNSTDVGRKP